MGIDFTVETETGGVLKRLGDPRANLPLYLSLADLDRTSCLRFIDPYGDTVFNGSQMPILLSELRSNASCLSDERLRSFRERELLKAVQAKWQDSVIASIRQAIGTPETRRQELAEIRSHIDELATGIEFAIAERPHVYVKFYGD
jgi:hypothetical protein